MSEDRYIICVPWGEEIVPSESFQCCECLGYVAVDKRNVAVTKHIKKICMLCASRKFGTNPSSDFGALIGGELKPVSESAIDKFRDVYKKVN